MRPISLLLPELSVADCRPRIRNERQYVVSLFVEKLAHIKDKKGKPFTTSYYAFMMSHLSIPELYSFYKQCEKGDVFAKVWFGALKERPQGYVPKWKTKKNEQS